MNNEALLTGTRSLYIFILGATEIEQVNKMFRLLGTPDETSWPGFGRLPHAKSFGFTKYPSRLAENFPLMTIHGMNLLKSLLCYSPNQRISAKEALNHAYFVTELPRPKDPSEFPEWESNSTRKKGSGETESQKLLEEEMRRELGAHVMGTTAFKLKY